MTSPKRAEPANEHAKLLRMIGSKAMNAAAAEIERLAARVRDLEERPRYDVAELRGKIVSSVKDNPIEAQKVHDTLATIHGFAALERPWLPIADAPRDGTRVELWCEHLDGINSGQFVRFASYGRYECGEDYEQWLSDAGLDLQPTHYRPEPAGPESKPDQETKGER